jgi:hypothetical protein
MIDIPGFIFEEAPNVQDLIVPMFSFKLLLPDYDRWDHYIHRLPCAYEVECKLSHKFTHYIKHATLPATDVVLPKSCHD